MLNKFVFFIIFNNVCAYNILVIFTLPLRSHYMAVKPLFEQLAIKGHNVTVINNFPEEQLISNIRYINLKNQQSKSSSIPALSVYEKDSTFLYLYNFARHIFATSNIVEQDCEHILQNEDVKSHIESGVKYDVIFVEQFMSDCGLVYATAHFDAPIIGIMSHVLLPWTYSRLGLPFDYRADPFYFTYFGRDASFLRKIEIFLLNTFFNTFGKFYVQRSVYRAFERNMPGYEFNVDELASNRMSMIFSYQHHSLTGGRLHAPQLLEIAGVHIHEQKELPKVNIN